MINILILCKERKNISMLAESICKCIDESLCLVSTTDVKEAAVLIEKQENIFDLFIISRSEECTSDLIAHFVT